MIRWLEKRQKFSWVITFLLALLIFYISSLPFRTLGTGTSLLAVIYHILIFFLLSLFLFISLVNRKKAKFFFFIAILFLVSYGILDELHQFFVPGRCTSLFDLGLDSLGILFAFMVYSISLNYRRVKYNHL